MITQAQQEANQQNALKGGVKSEAGKEIVKYNAVRHGVLTKALVDEEVEGANKIQYQLMQDYQPRTLAEELLIETMTIAYTRRQRAVNAEREYLMEILNPTTCEARWIVRPLIDYEAPDLIHGKQEIFNVKEGFHAKFKQDQIDNVDKTYSRYINTCERQFYRALHELQRIQALRNGHKITSMAMDVFSDKSEE